MKVERRAYGLWDSPVTPISLSRGIGFYALGCDQQDSLVWLEGRGDRGVLVVQHPDGQAPRDLNSELSVRARVGYGGGEFTIDQGLIYFVESESGRIYRQPASSGQAVPLTPAFGHAASPAVSPDGRWLVFVHNYEEQDRLAIVDNSAKYWPQVLVSGEDFYMQPAWHPDGKRIAWIAWNHPNMPWDGTFLRLATLQEGNPLPSVDQVRTIAGGEQVSIFQPQFSPDGRFLAYVSDESGWWQIYLFDLESGEHRQITHSDAEHGLPAWVQGMRTYTFSSDGKRIVFIRELDGAASLWIYDIDEGNEQPLVLDEEYTSFGHICRTSYGIGVVASSGTIPSRVLTVKLPAKGTHVLARASSEELSASDYSSAQAITWTGMDGGMVHGLFYAPKNNSFEGIGKPPLLVKIHGGPTSQSIKAFDSSTQFFTSRGYAVLDVNYRGSTGYGREYRNMLRESWGIYDVQDAVSGARSLAEQGKVDGNRMVIYGGSAGGFTVLKALEDYPTFFKAGICLYGVSNQFTLAAETHKFEARYSDTLLGPLPEASDLYRERSPIFFVDKIVDPVAIFQGEIDNVVPRKQSDEVAASLERRGVPHIYHIYPGEGHGFRKPETIEHFYKTVEAFLREFVIFA